MNEELSLLQSTDKVLIELFYHYEINGAVDSDKVLFHAIGAWASSRTFTKPMHHITSRVGLDDATTENG